MLISPCRQTFSVSDLLVCKFGTLRLPFTLLCLFYLFQKQAGQGRDCLCGCTYLCSLNSTVRSPCQFMSLAVLTKNWVFKCSHTEHPRLSATAGPCLWGPLAAVAFHASFTFPPLRDLDKPGPLFILRNCHVTSFPLRTSLTSAIDEIGKSTVIINVLYLEILSGINTLCKGTNQP